MVRRQISFNEDVEVISFGRVFGVCVVPSEGLLAISLGSEVGRSIEKLGYNQEVRDEEDFSDSFKAPNQRAALLKHDLGLDAYHAHYLPLREEMISYKKLRQESALSEDDIRFMCESPLDGVAQGRIDAAEVKMLLAQPWDDIAEPVPQEEVTQRWRPSNNRKRRLMSPYPKTLALSDEPTKILVGEKKARKRDSPAPSKKKLPSDASTKAPSNASSSSDDLSSRKGWIETLTSMLSFGKETKPDIGSSRKRSLDGASTSAKKLQRAKP